MFVDILETARFQNDALPLRFQAFHDELGFVRGPTVPREMEDDLDNRSTQLAIYYGGDLACCWRLITGVSPERLPTMRILRNAIPVPTSAAEVSKLVVRSQYRGHGLAGAALLASIIEARKLAVETLWISVISEPRFTSFLTRLGFCLVEDRLSFTDDKIEATQAAAAFRMTIASLQDSLETMESHLRKKLDDIRHAIETDS